MMRITNGGIAAACLAALLASAPALAAGGVEWGYHGDLGPQAWGSLTDSHGNLAYPLCGEGKSQSPIDIPSNASKTARLTPIQFDYKASPLRIKNNGHTIQVTYQKGSTITVNGATYDLLQFHFHLPSENQVDGRSFPMEGHLVHARGSGANTELAVVGFLMAEGDRNPFLRPIWDNMPANKGEVKVKGKAFDAAMLLPAKRTYYAFDGSLTTPPCSEGVKWHVLADPIQISRKQVERFARIFRGTNRPVQPLNGRAVTRPKP